MRSWGLRDALLTALVLVVLAVPVRAVASAGGPVGPPVATGPSLGFLLQGDSLDEQIGGATRGLFREIRRYWRNLSWMFGRAVDWWGTWIKQGAFYFAVALVAALADSGLIHAWRQEGLRVLITYVPLMLYVYGRLLLSSAVKLAPKLLLLGALIYGVVRRDLLPDKSMIPGRVEDVLLIVVATRAFVYACPEALIDEFAERAVTLRRRISGASARPR